MYDSCCYNKALVLESYPAWCGLFTRQELQVCLSIYVINYS